MNRGEKIFLYYFLADHDGILEIVSLPGHERHFQVTTQGQFAILHGISFGQEIAFLDLLAFPDGRLQVDTGFLVGFDELGQLIDLQVFFKRHQFLLLVPVITDMDFVGVDKFNDTFPF